MTNQNEKPAAGYRGSFVYQQEYSYKLITLMVSLRTRRLIERLAGLPLAGKARYHLGSPLCAVSLKDSLTAYRRAQLNIDNVPRRGCAPNCFNSIAVYSKL